MKYVFLNVRPCCHSNGWDRMELVLNAVVDLFACEHSSPPL